jgi:MFS family permease
MDNYVLIMAPAIILASVFTLFYGRVYDKFKFEKSVFPALLTLILGYILLYFFRNTALVFIGSLLMMCGYLAGMAVFGAVIRDNTPPKKAGMFQGLRIFAQVLIPGIIGPFIGAGVLKNAEQIINNDGTTSFIPNENIFLSALIVAVIVVVLLIFLFYFKKKKEIKK